MKKIGDESLYDLKNLSQLLVDKENVFYLETMISKKENKYLSSIYRLNLKTNERTHFGDSGNIHTKIERSPDGKYLTYLSNNSLDEKMQIFAIPLAGGSAVQLTHEKNGVSHYLWVRDSSRIYYQTFKEDKEQTVEKNEELANKTVITKLKYKEDGHGSLKENHRHQIKRIIIENVNKEIEPELIVEKDRSLVLSYVSKDETYLLYFDHFDPENEWLYGGTIFRYDLVTKEAENLTSEIPEGIFSFAEASEDEKYLLLIGNDFSYKFVTDNDIYLYNQEQESLKNLTSDLDFGVGDSLVGDFQQNLAGPDLLWLEDRKSFLFKVTEHGKITLYKGNLKGEIHKLVNKEMHITSFALSRDKKKVYISYSDSTTPSKLAVIDLETTKLENIYNPNEEFMNTHKFSKPEMFWYKSVNDWDIQAWYVPPLEALDKHPAILYIHGGPQVSYGETFFHEMQSLAAKGYGIIMINPRGGSGYGQEFVASILDNYGDEDYQDLLNGLDYVLKKYPSINEEQVYLAGGSYGGFMTNWMVTHTNRFKAAATQRSISNWISFYGTSDIGPSFVEFQLGRDLTKADELWAMSPLAHAENAKTPLLIIHGEEDLRCPLEQAEQFYIAMKKYEVDTRLVIFPQSSHGLSRNGLPNLRIQRLEEISSWFKQYS